MGGLRAEDLVFVARSEKFSAIGGEKGQEWSDERWERGVAHIRRMEFNRRATAPRRLTELTMIQAFDVLANALTRNEAQLFPTRRRPILRTLTGADAWTTEEWFQTRGISIGDSLTESHRAKAIFALHLARYI